MEADPLCGPDRLAKLLPLVERLDRELADPLDFACPVIAVRTDDGYDPPLETVTSTIDDIYSRPQVHDLDKMQSPGQS